MIFARLLKLGLVTNSYELIVALLIGIAVRVNDVFDLCRDTLTVVEGWAAVVGITRMVFIDDNGIFFG